MRDINRGADTKPEWNPEPESQRPRATPRNKVPEADQESQRQYDRKPVLKPELEAKPGPETKRPRARPINREPEPNPEGQSNRPSQNDSQSQGYRATGQDPELESKQEPYPEPENQSQRKSLRAPVRARTKTRYRDRDREA